MRTSDHRAETAFQHFNRDVGQAVPDPLAQIGQVTCESKHDTCSGTFFINQSGVEVMLAASGRFTLDHAAGVGFITYDVGPGLFFLPIRFVIMENGKEIRGMPIVPGYNVICTLKAQ